jgi:drug/metabolite transporter (DMT)-like permease
MNFLPIILAIITSMLYHLFQKLTPAGANPILALIITYLTATLASLLLLPAFPLSVNLRESLKGINWVSVALGVTIVGLELGYLLAYRAGWNISIAGIFSNATVALLLIPIGMALFNEKLSAFNLAGILFCTLGLVLVNWRV